MIKNLALKFYCLLFLLMWTQTAVAVEVILWEHERDEILQVLDKLIKEFETKNKNIKIKRSHYKTEDLRTQFQTAALGGGGPEILIGPNDFAGPLSLMGLISPTNGLFDASKFFPEVTGGVQDGKNIWGLPISRGNHLMLFVNKKLIKEGAPDTLEKLIVSAKKATNKSTYGFAYNLTEPFWFVTFMSAFGGLPLVNGKPDLNSKAVVDALSFVKDLKFKDKIVPADCDYTCADTLFVEGKAAMTINGDWSVAKYSEALLEKDAKGRITNNLIIAPLPMLAATQKYMQPMVSGKYVFINSRAKGAAKDAAIKFGQFLMNLRNQEALADKGGRLPALKAAAESPVVTKNVQLMASQDALEHGQPMPMDVGLRAVWDAIRPQLQGVMAGRLEPKKAAEAMQKDAEIKIKEMQQ